jgi:hypothetical protein
MEKHAGIGYHLESKLFPLERYSLPGLLFSLFHVHLSSEDLE